MLNDGNVVGYGQSRSKTVNAALAAGEPSTASTPAIQVFRRLFNAPAFLPGDGIPHMQKNAAWSRFEMMTKRHKDLGSIVEQLHDSKINETQHKQIYIRYSIN